jgi:hypothetical protein
MRSAIAARWPVARATLIALAIVIGLLDGCPLPHPAKTPKWALGTVETLARIRTTLLAPVAFVGRDLDVSQRWALFRGASHLRWRLYVEGQTADLQWHLRFRAGDPEHTDYLEQLEYRRMRGTFNPSGQHMRGQYRQFAHWMAARVLADHPEYVAARTRFEQILIDGGSYTPTGEFSFENTRKRALPGGRAGGPR